MKLLANLGLSFVALWPITIVSLIYSYNHGLVSHQTVDYALYGPLVVGGIVATVGALMTIWKH